MYDIQSCYNVNVVYHYYLRNRKGNLVLQVLSDDFVYNNNDVDRLNDHIIVEKKRMRIPLVKLSSRELSNIRVFP